MGTKEMSDTFDILYNNITSNQAPGLNEMEKSVFLTKAQDEVIKNYFVPEGNPHQKGFDDSQKRQIDFSMLINVNKLTPSSTEGKDCLDPRAYTYNLPSDIMFIINESLYLDDTKTKIRQVIPISYDEYTRLMSKPYKEPLRYQAWRLMSQTSNVPVAEVILNSSDKKVSSSPTYVVRSVKRPNPIILVDLEESFGEDLKIHGKSEETPCELDPSIHEEILQRAVELAKIAWQGDTNAIVQAGQRSE